MLPVEDMSVKKHKTCFWKNWRRATAKGEFARNWWAASCLTKAVYFIVYFTVSSVRAPTYRNRHGGVRSTAIAEANIF